MQKLFYLSQQRKANQTFPEVDSSPESTSWYTDPDKMEGSEKGSSAEGHSTAYDRMRVATSLSTIIFPVYNYGREARATGSSTTAMSGYMSFEADGSYTGFSGCNYEPAAYSQFESSDANSAYIVNPGLCPRGKFGYDPRCRGWYADSKRQYFESGDGLYISPPYKFAASTDIGNSAASPLVDPKSGEFVGNTLIDFTTSELSKFVSKAEFYAVIMPNTTDGQNVVASSAFEDDTTPESIFEMLMPYDDADSTNAQYFSEIIRDMENKGTGADCTLYRTNEQDVQQQFCYVYEPIYNRALRPVKPDDFSRGALHSTEFLYSIIMFQEVNVVSSEYMKRSDDIDRALHRTAVIYFLTTVLTTLIFIIVTAKVSGLYNMVFNVLSHFTLPATPRPRNPFCFFSLIVAILGPSPW